MSRLLMYCVDHDPVSRIVLKSIFEHDHEVELFDSAEACLAAVEARRPDLMLLDVELPGMDGYALCRHIKDDYATRQVPVLFISHGEDLDARLRGYEAGGEDFILKPYALGEVRRRVAVVQRALDDAAGLRQQVSDAEMLSGLLLSNMDEYAVLIKFMRALNESADVEALAQALLDMLRAFRLHGPVQLRTPWQTLTLSEQGRDRPLEQAVIGHMATMERIFEFNTRSVYNFERVTVLVNDMPVDDSELCGRLRDHLAIAAEMADARMQSLIAASRLQATQSALAEVLQETRRTLSNYRSRQAQLRHDGIEHAQALVNRLVVSFAPLGLSAELEEEIVDMVHARTQDILALFHSADDTAATLLGLEQRLEQALQQT